MKRSFLKLIGSSVLACWVIGFGILYAYSTTLNWDEASTRRHGILWAYQTLDQASAAERPALLAAMDGHFGVALALAPIEQVERETGAQPEAGHSYFNRRQRRLQWLYIPFHDGGSALVAGPFDPTRPAGYYPIGIFLAILFTPLVASLVALRLAKQLRKVELASEALGAGELSARVDNPDGPSHELAASFNAMAERVERLVKDREELVQAVSHELGSPLSRLQFQLELLENDHSKAERRARLDAMAHEIDELNELVSELLSWVQSDAAALKRETFDAAKPLGDLADLAQLHAPSGDEVSVRAELPASAAIHADPRLFQRAIENLLRNAVRYGKSAVSVSLAQADGFVKVIVEDDGPGIDADERERVLEPFVRIQADRDRDTGGAGLGLAIVNRIVRNHGGAIAIDEASLGGARITTTWPAAPLKAESAAATA